MTQGVSGRQVGAFIGKMLLSCGISQLYGLIKGAIDTVKLIAINVHLRHLTKIQEYIKEHPGDLASMRKRIRRLEPRLARLFNEADHVEDISAGIKNIKDKYLFKKTRKKRALKSDAAALTPLFGAHLAWAAFKGDTSRIFEANILGSAGSIVEAHTPTLQKMFYPLSGEVLPFGVSYRDDEVEIEVSVPGSPKRSLTAIHKRHDDGVPRPTIVLFHGNGMKGPDCESWGKLYYDRGFDVLMPTMGGYPGSPGIDTSEASSYQDVEAVKNYLASQGVTKAGFHGISIGGTLAFQAGTTEHEKVKTLFVVGDQTLASAVAVAERMMHNNAPVLRSAARSVAAEAVPVGKPVALPGGKSTVTDGLNNLAKAERLKCDLLTIGSDQDNLMGIQSDILVGENFSRDLLQARYDAEDRRREDNHIRLEGGHCSFFGRDAEAVEAWERFITPHLPESQ